MAKAQTVGGQSRPSGPVLVTPEGEAVGTAKVPQSAGSSTETKRKKKKKQQPLTERQKSELFVKSSSIALKRGAITESQLRKLTEGELSASQRKNVINRISKFTDQAFKQQFPQRAQRAQEIEQFRQDLQTERQQSIPRSEAERLFDQRTQSTPRRQRQIEQFRQRLEQRRRQSLTTSEAEQTRQEIEQDRQQSLQTAELAREAQQRQVKQFSVVVPTARQAPEISRQIREQGGEITRRELVGTGRSGTTQALIEFRSSKAPEFETENLPTAREVGLERRARTRFLQQSRGTALGTTAITAFRSPFQTAGNFLEQGGSVGISLQLARGERPFKEIRERQIEREIGTIKGAIITSDRGLGDFRGAGIEFAKTAEFPLTAAAGGVAGRGVSLASRGARRVGTRLIGRTATRSIRGITLGGLTAGTGVIEAQRIKGLEQQRREGELTTGEFGGAIAEDVAKIGLFGSGFARGLSRNRQVLLSTGRLEVAQAARGRTLQRSGQARTFRREVPAEEIDTLRSAKILEARQTGAGRVVTRGVREGQELRLAQFLETTPSRAKRAARQEAGDLQEFGGFVQELQAPSRPNQFFISQAGRAEIGFPLKTTRTRSSREPFISGPDININLPRLPRRRRTGKFRELDERINIENTLTALTRPRSKSKRQASGDLGPAGAETPQPSPSAFGQAFGDLLGKRPQTATFEDFAPTLLPERFKAPRFFLRRPEQRQRTQDIRISSQRRIDSDVTTLDTQRPSQLVGQDQPIIERLGKDLLGRQRQEPARRQRQRKAPRTTRIPFQIPRQAPRLQTPTPQLRQRPDLRQKQKLTQRRPRRPRRPVEPPVFKPRETTEIFKPPKKQLLRFPERRRRKKGKKIFFSDPLSLSKSVVNFGKATSPKNTLDVIKQARSTSFLQVPTVEQRRGKKQNNSKGLLGGIKI